MQVLLVTGGRHNKTGLWTLDSTEILEGIAGTWRLTAPLPSSARFGLSAASVENNIFIFGENILFLLYDSSISRSLLTECRVLTMYTNTYQY